MFCNHMSIKMDIADNIILPIDHDVAKVIGVTSDERYIVYTVGRDIICRDLVNNKIVWRKVPPAWLERISIYPQTNSFHIYKDKEEWFVAIEYLDTLIRKSMVTGAEDSAQLEDDTSILRIYSNVTSLILQSHDIYIYYRTTDRKFWVCDINRWTTIDISHDGQVLVIIDEFGLSMIDIQYGDISWCNKEVDQFSSLTLSPNGTTIATFNEDCIWLIDYTDGHLIREIYLHGSTINDIEYSSDGELLFVNKENGESIIVNISGEIVWNWNGQFIYNHGCRYNKQKIWMDENDMKYIMNANARDIDKWGVEMKRVYYDSTSCDINFTDFGNIVYRDNLDFSRDCVQENLYLCRNPMENWTVQTHHLNFKSKKRTIETLFTVRNVSFPDVPNEVLYIICGLL